MPLDDCLIKECSSCERRFDVNFASRMREYQKLHRREQPHLFGECGFLMRKFYDRGLTAELYNTPWEKKPRNVWFCSEGCEESYCRSGSFDYVICTSCDREVCQQNPVNGWHVQFRNHEDLGYICLRCYEGEILKNGQPRSDFEGNQMKGGMFFSRGNLEAEDAGFEEVMGFRNYFVNGREHILKYNRTALDLIDSGHKVITGFERLRIGGLEGYVTMMYKSLGKSHAMRRRSPTQATRPLEVIQYRKHRNKNR